MSAWYVFNALGFYPVNPSSAEYVVGTPLFDRVDITFPSRPSATDAGAAPHKLSITAAGAANRPYVKALRKDGVASASPVLRHAELYRLSELEFSMSEEPQRWGAGVL